ncbi:MAG: hypothetical protein V7670_15075 [Maribacter arcticus]|uniref:hypothetical protein n=1 Tax=Maribacter arcticus TaxID=561365 RepID=UPI00300224DB
MRIIMLHSSPFKHHGTAIHYFENGNRKQMNVKVNGECIHYYKMALLNYKDAIPLKPVR